MASSTSNQDLTISTTGTQHAGVTLGPTDVCKVPPNNMAPAPFPNEAHTSKAENPTTPRTQIAAAKIITIDTRFGTPPNSLPVHIGSGGGVKSGTYIRWAKATSASPDVFAENKAVVRHTDPTEQNQANTVGFVIDMALGKDAEIAKMKKLARCMVVELKVTCKHNGRAMVGGLLEVLQGDTLSLVATRKNGTAEKGTSAYDTPICQPPPGGHQKTRFRITRSRCSWAGLLQKTDPSPFDGADKKDLGPDWTGEEPKPPPAPATTPKLNPTMKMPSGASAKSPTSGDAADKEATRVAGVASERLRIEQNYNGQRPGVAESAFQHRTGPTVSGSGSTDSAASAQTFASAIKADEYRARRAEADRTYNETRAALKAKNAAYEKTASDARLMKVAVTSFEMAKTLWRCQPAEITIAATGCVGAKSGLVKVYPAGEFELDLMKLKDFLALWKRFRDMLQKFNELCEMLKPKGNGFGIAFLDGPVVKFKWEYKECTKVSTDGELKPHHVGMDWSGLIGFEQLVKFTASLTVSLLKAAGILGDLVAWVLAKFDIRVDLVLEAELGIGFVLEFGKTEHRENKAMSLTAPVVAQFSMSLVFKAGSFASATFKITLAFKPVLQGVRMPKWYKVEFQTKETVVSVTYEMVFKADVWGFRDGKKFGGNVIDPIKYGPAWVDPLPFLN